MSSAPGGNQMTNRPLRSVVAVSGDQDWSSPRVAIQMN